MGRPKSNGVYAKLSATYYDDDAILEAGPHAELLWVRYLAFTALVPTDGYVTDRQMRVRVGRGLRDVSGRLRALVDAGLLVAVDDGYVSRSWQKWNRSAEQIGRHLARDRERKARKSGEIASNSARNGDSFQSNSGDQSKAKQGKTDKPSVQPAAAHKSDYPEEFESWWSLYPRKESKGAALKAWQKARKLVDPETLAAATQAYTLMCLGKEKQFVKLPAGWLNDRKWEDDYSSPGVRPAAPTLGAEGALCARHVGYPLPCIRCGEEEVPF